MYTPGAVSPVESVQDPAFEQLFPNSESAKTQAWSASDFDRRVAESIELLRIEIAEELRAKFDSELENRIAAETQELVEEIDAVQEALQRKEAELDGKLMEDPFPFGEILKLRTEKLELTSYLRGLKFRAATARIRG
jgi:hypothetical protein